MKRKTGSRFVQSLCLFVFLMMLSSSVGVKASSADITISASNEECVKGSYTEIFIDIEADVLPGDFEGYLLYDKNILEYVPGPEIVTGGEGVLKISDTVMNPTRNSRRYSLKFKAVSSGECEISLRDTPELYEFEEGYLMSVSVSNVTVKVTGDPDVKSDLRLAVLKVSPGKLDPVFSSEIYEYRTSVPADVEKLIVSAAPVDLNSKVEVAGNGNLEYGNNRIKVTVTGENGKTAEYVIICERSGEAESGSENPGKTDGNDDPEDGDHGTVTTVPDPDAAPIGIRVFSSEDDIHIRIGQDYVLSDDTGDVEIPDGYKKTSMVIDGVNVPVYAAESPDAYMLIILKNENGETHLYSYDRTEKTLQRYKEKNDEKTATVMTDSIEALELANSYDKSLNTLTLIIAILSGLSMALLIIVIRMALKGRNDGLDD